MTRKIVIVVVFAFVVCLVFAVFLLVSREEEKKIAEFMEYCDSFIYLDTDGDASCTMVVSLPPSELSDFMKQLVQLMGTETIGKSYEEQTLGSYARCGIEVENITYEVTGFGIDDNFEFTLSWEVPHMARWSDNRWTIDLNWIDAERAAEETIAQMESSWVMVRSIANMLDIDVAFEIYSYRSVTVLPEGATNVQFSVPTTYEFLDYGGGSYSEGSVGLSEVDGRIAIVENGVIVTATENEITLTPQQLLENYFTYTISYEGVPPENPSFFRSLDEVRLDLKYGKKLDNDYSIYRDGVWYSLTPSQLLYYTAEAIVEINRENSFSVPQPTVNVLPPESESGDWSASWKDISRDEYVALAEAVLNDMEADNVAPGWVFSPIGKIRFRDMLYTFTRVLSSYHKLGELPETITFAPSPAGVLMWEEDVIPAEDAYYLLSDSYVIVGGPEASAVLENFPDNLDNRALAEEICNWTGSNISYGLYFKPPTSEDLLVSRSGQCRDFTNLYLALARTAGLPARRVSGWIQSGWMPPSGWEFVVTTTPDGKTVASHAWVQVYLPGEGWVPVEPQSKRPELYVGSLPYEVYRKSEQTWTGALAGYETANGLL